MLVGQSIRVLWPELDTQSRLFALVTLTLTWWSVLVWHLVKNKDVFSGYNITGFHQQQRFQLWARL